MTSYFKKYSDKKTEYLLLGLSIILFSVPILIYGNNDYETYYWGYFSNKIYNETFFNPLKNFIDYYGPGTSVPLGFFPYYHPLSIIFVNNYKFFVFFSLILNLFLQYAYLKKIFKFFNLKKFYLLLPPIVVFSISNFNYVWSSDWIQVFYTYTFFFPCFYYFLRLSKKSDLNLFVKLSFIFGFSIINSHPGVLINFFLFLIFFSFFNNYYKHLKNKFFYIFICLVILICIEIIYFQISEYLKYQENYPEIKKIVQDPFLWKHYAASILLPLNFSDWTEMNRYPFYGFVFFLSFYKSIQITIQKKSKTYYFIDYIFYIFIFLSLSTITKKILFVSAVWQLRDIINILSLILFFIFFNEMKKNKLKKMLTLFCIIFIFVFYVGNFKNNVQLNNQKISESRLEIKDKFNTLFKDINSNKFENRIYMSPNFFTDLHQLKFKNYGLFSITDFTKFNLAPFNGSFKGVYLGHFNKPFTKTRSYIVPSFSYINNDFFMNIFKIKYLLIYQSEMMKITNLSDFKIINKMDVVVGKELKKEKLNLLERINYNNNVQLTKSFNQFVSCKNDIILNCINSNLENLKLTDKIKIKFDSKNLFYTFNNLTNEEIFLITPFLFDSNWKSIEKESIINFDNKLMILKLRKNNVTSIRYKDKFRETLKIISITSLVLIIIYLTLKKLQIFRSTVFK